MPYIDHEETPDFAEDEDDQGVTCRHCQQDGLYWQKVWDAGGKEKPVLFDSTNDRRHVCKPSADDFEVLA